MRIRVATVVVLFLAISARAATLVVLPFDNFTGADNAAETVHALALKSVALKGWTIAPDEQIETVLEKNRVRYLDSLDDSVRTAILEPAGASALLSGTIYTYSEGRNPIVAVSARLVRADGTLAWADVAAASADDTEGVLGFGRASTTERVAFEVVNALMHDFPRAGAESSPGRGKAKPFMHRGPSSFHTTELDAASPHIVCVLPFENPSSVPEGARVVADILSIRLAAANGFEVVEPAKLRAAALKAHIGSFRGIASEDLERLASSVGTSLFIRGTIFQYADATGRAAADPALQLDLSLIDAQSRRILWAAQHDRKGSDYIGFLMRGAASNAVSLTDRVITEIVDAATRGAVGSKSGNSRAAQLRAKGGQ